LCRISIVVSVMRASNCSRDLHMVVGRDPALLPRGILIGRRRKGFELAAKCDALYSAAPHSGG